MTDPNPDKPFHFVPNLVKHPANLAVDPLEQNDAQPGGLEGEDFLEARALAIERDALEQPGGERRVPRPVDRDLVFLFDLVARMSQALSEVAVVGEKEKAFGLGVEPTDIEEPREMRRQEIEDGIARVRIAPRRNKTGRFMQHDVEPALAVHQFAIDFYMVALAGLNAEIGADLAVDRNATGGDEVIAMSARTEPGRGKETIEAHGGRSVEGLNRGSVEA